MNTQKRILRLLTRQSCLTTRDITLRLGCSKTSAITLLHHLELMGKVKKEKIVHGYAYSLGCDEELPLDIVANDVKQALTGSKLFLEDVAKKSGWSKTTVRYALRRLGYRPTSKTRSAHWVKTGRKE